MKRFALVFLLFLSAACSTVTETIPVTLLHVNDVYEITPIAGGKEGGLARVATLRAQLQQKNPNTFLLFAGDAFSPSALGTAVVNGKPLAGKQMVDVMNAVGFDYATFGNHEFDLAESLFLERLKESKFRWLSSNVRDGEGKPFPGVSEFEILTVAGPRGKALRIGILGVTISLTSNKYAVFADPLETARRYAAMLAEKVDVVVAMTHLDFFDDAEIAAFVPRIDLIVGGHEHENLKMYRGKDFTPVCKADANARSAYVHELRWNPRSKRVTIDSSLRVIDEGIAEDPRVASIAQRWVDLAYAAFRESGFSPDQLVATTDVALEGEEAAVRNRQTNMGELIGSAMLREAPDADLAVMNSGSIRIDDTIAPGPLLQYDVIRILPFGGKILLVEMSGSLLQRLLEQGERNRGIGSYLQRVNVTRDPGGELRIASAPIDPAKTYRVAMNDFLLKGIDKGLEFLTRDAPGVGAVVEKRDIRFAVIDEVRARWPAAH